MPTDRDKLLKGVRFLAIGFPFIFMGPIVMTSAGIPGYNNGNYWWLAISIIFMLTAAFFCVRGLKTVLSAFFDGKKN